MNKLQFKHVLFISLILLLALALRLWGIQWGLPNSERYYSYHPDEFLLVGTATNIAFNDSFFPGFYNYPSLFSYIGAFMFMIAAWVKGILGASDVYLLLRCISIVFGTLCVLATYFATKSMFKCRAMSLCAAAFVAIMPLHVQHSHFATTDILCTFFVAVTFVFIGRIYTRGRQNDFMYAGLMAGLAVGSRYNVVLLVFPMLVANLLSEKRNLKQFFASLGAMVCMFVLTTPGCVFDAKKFFADIMYEFAHSQNGHDLVFAGMNGFADCLNSLWYGLGGFLSIFALAAIVWGIAKRDKGVYILLSYCIPCFIFISLSSIRFARYSLMMYPAIAMLVGYFVWSVYKTVSPNEKHRDAWLILVCGVFWLTLVYSAALDNMMCLKTPQARAGEYIKKHVKSGDSIGIMEQVWFFSPLIDKIGGLGDLNLRMKTLGESSYNITLMLKEKKYDADWVCLSDYEIADARRVRNCKKLTPQQKQRAADINEMIDKVEENYEAAETFKTELEIKGYRIFDSARLPHDMRYPAPLITVYKHK